MNGVILRKGDKGSLVPNVGEMQFVEDTDEFLIKEDGNLVYRANKLDNTRYGVTVSEDLIGGDAGDYILSNMSEYFKTNIWNIRPISYTELHMLENFEIKVDWGGYFTRNGIIGIDELTFNNYNKTDWTLVPKIQVDSTINALNLGSSISVSGDQMDNSYSPVLGGDVLTVDSLVDGSVLFIPPTTKPNTVGGLWNDSGELKFVN